MPGDMANYQGLFDRCMLVDVFAAAIAAIQANMGKPGSGNSNRSLNCRLFVAQWHIQKASRKIGLSELSSQRLGVNGCVVHALSLTDITYAKSLKTRNANFNAGWNVGRGGNDRPIRLSKKGILGIVAEEVGAEPSEGWDFLVCHTHSISPSCRLLSDRV
jgi:hypothetical protein